MAKDDALLKEIRDRKKLAIDAERENRSTYLEDYRFSIGDEENNYQWDPDAHAARTAKGVDRPCITVNKVNGTAKLITNQIRQNKVSIKVKPVDSDKDPGTTKIFEGLIRNIENVSIADTAYDNSANNAVRGGWGYWRIINDYSDELSVEQDIFIERIVNPLAVYIDPSAKRQDRSDMKWAFIDDTVPIEEYKIDYPKSKALADIIESGLGDDKNHWITKESIRVSEYYRIAHKREKLYLLEDGRTVKGTDTKDKEWIVFEVLDGLVVGEETEVDLEDGKYLLAGEEHFRIVKERDTKIPKVEWYKTNGVEILSGPETVPGRYIPIVTVLGDEQWLEGKQLLRSAIHYAKEPNRLYNWDRSTDVETRSMAPKQPFIISKAQIKGLEHIWDVAHKTPLPYLPYNDVPGLTPPMRQSGSISDSGANNGAMIAADDIKATTGFYDASLGNRSNETSGVAINSRKLQGDTMNFNIMDNLVVAMKYSTKILLYMIPEVYDSERVVRLLNDDGSEAWETINQTVKDPTAPDGKRYINDLSVGKFDAVLTVGQPYATQRMESAEVLTQLATALPQFGAIIAPRLVKTLDILEADDMAEEMKQLSQPPQEQGPSEEKTVDLINKTLTAEGKKLINTKRQQEIAGTVQDQDERTKQLIVEALQHLGFIPNTP